jgi:hypothetical protein
MVLDKESLTSRKKLGEEEIKVDKTTDKHSRSKQEQEQQQVFG